MIFTDDIKHLLKNPIAIIVTIGSDYLAVIIRVV